MKIALSIQRSIERLIYIYIGRAFILTFLKYRNILIFVIINTDTDKNPVVFAQTNAIILSLLIFWLGTNFSLAL